MVRRISVIGLGYVGLPVAIAFARCGHEVVGFDIDGGRIAELARGIDRTNEVAAADLSLPSLHLTTDPERLRQADFHIVTVPTPISTDKRPDLAPLLAASRTVGQALTPGAIVVYESTVYPGVTVNECVPVLEAASGLVFGHGFTVGYSPERINPGDREHRLETVTKVVSGSDEATLDTIAKVYGTVVPSVHRASSILVAEAAKVIENTQRDINIALMNELALIFHRLGIDSGEVLAAAGTKWNFVKFAPGLVGGHCIGVDPYYLTYCAELLGYHPQVILAGRRINDSMGTIIGHEVVKQLLNRGALNGCLRVAILGFTFKENVPDIRNTRVIDIISALRDFGALVEVHDPLASSVQVEQEYGFALRRLDAMAGYDAVVLAVAHEAYRTLGWDQMAALLKDGGGLVVDIKGMLDVDLIPAGITLWRL